MKKSLIEFYTRLAHGLAVQFGSNCEVVVHDLQGKDIEHSIIAIENGHVTGRRIGDGPSQIVLESLHNSKQNLKQEEKLAYLTKTKNGKICGGLNVTKDGDFEVYVEQKMDLNDEMSGKILEKQIKIFAQFINGLDMGKVK